tara:strand:- start:69 stop:881 length:813 start_codon:yes stop_codon:yes gene_type:complete
MKFYSTKPNSTKKAIALGAAALLASFTLLPQFASASICYGNCGTLGTDGDVTTSPQGGTYDYVSTFDGVDDAPNLGIGSETNGSVFQTDAFAALAGDSLEFYFNFVTSDGTVSYIEYAWARLLNEDLTESALLFTARTNPDGTTTVPGVGLPPLQATINPSSALINDGASNWSGLGTSSGSCYGGIGAGCGSTGWVQSLFDISVAGNYILEFGVTNWGDTSYQTGMAYDGITVGGVSIDPDEPNLVPVPTTLALFGLGLAGIGWSRRKKA